MYLYWVVSKRSSFGSIEESLYYGWNDTWGTSYTNLVDVSPQMMIKDSKTFNTNWRVYKKQSTQLISGQDMTLTLKNPRPYTYYPHVHDNESYENLRGHTVALIVMVQGVVHHDITTPTLVGTSQAQIDFVERDEWKYSLKKKLTTYLGTRTGTLDTVNSGEFADPSGGTDTFLSNTLRF